MADKEKIKEEIKRRINLIQDTNVASYADGWIQAYKELLQFINSLPEEYNEDLEEEMIRWHKEHFGNKRDWEKTSGEYLTRKSQLDIARHFAEWQREKDIKLEKIDDLEEFAQKWAYSNYHEEMEGVNCDCLYSGVKKGAEWQKQQMKEALQTEYEKGRFDMREEMMKDAVEGDIFREIKSSSNIEFQLCSKRFKMEGIKLGDKVKIIIVKTEQQ